MKDTDLHSSQTRESLDFALESGKMATWDINLETNTVSCSKEMLELWGIQSSNSIHERSLLQSKVHPEDLDKMNSAIDLAIKSRSIYELEYRIIPKPAEIRWVLSRGRCTFGKDSQKPVRFAGIVYDITEKKQKEIELAHALKARSDFLTVAGHELKTPLTCMQLQLKVLESQLEDLSLHEKANDLIVKGLKKQQDHLLRISNIVHNMLDETKITEGLFRLQYERFDLSELVRDVIEQVTLIASADGIKVAQSNLEKIEGRWDRFRIEQVLINLVMNGIRYGNKKPIHIELFKEKGKANLVVRDKGIGISSEDHSRIFQRFVRVNKDSRTNGMGLGLFISHFIVHEHQGEIRVKSELGKGSEFVVVLPINE